MVGMEESISVAIGRATDSRLSDGVTGRAPSRRSRDSSRRKMSSRPSARLGNYDEVAETVAIWANMRLVFTPLAAYSFLIFNLLCAPCFAAVGAIRREMNSAKWTWFAVG